MSNVLYVAQAAVSSSGDSNIVTIVYILTGISLVLGFIAGTYKYVQRQKKKWTEEGVTRQKQAQAMEENTAQMVKNTEAIEKLTTKFGDFALSVRQEMNGLGERLGKLEVWRHQVGDKHDGS